MEPFRPLVLAPPALRLLDQTLLPASEAWVTLTDVESLCEAIANLRVRGAPLLGLAGAAGIALASEADTSEAALRHACERIASVRPTAVELRTGAEAALRAVVNVPAAERRETAWTFAAGYFERRVAEDEALANFGLAAVPPGAVLTHCNTGALATGGIGTALGIIIRAHERGRLTRCFATETRPLLQGARLTMWELLRAGVPAVLLPDTAAAALIASGAVQAVVTGADRMARNGDSANKIGTYGLALAAARSNVPFFIAAPCSTIDFSCADGSQIPIEFRADSEVGGFGAARWSPEGGAVYNPAFDVTPADLIASIITERGVAMPPFDASLAAFASTP